MQKKWFHLYVKIHLTNTKKKDTELYIGEILSVCVEGEETILGQHRLLMNTLYMENMQIKTFRNVLIKL